MAAAALLLLLLMARPPSESLPAPVVAGAGDVAIPVSPAVRAATVARIPKMPAQAATVRLACDISLYSGEPRRCVPAETLPRLSTWEAFYHACDSFAAALEEPNADPLVRAAFERVRALRVQVEGIARPEDRKLMLFTETVSAADALPPLPPAEQVKASEVTFEDSPAAAAMDRLFPETALRNEEWATVTVLCRVLADRSLLCRDGEVAPLSPVRTATGRLFVLVTYQAMSLRKVAPLAHDGRPLVGRDIVTHVGWRIRDSGEAP
jgi:hypothetical protein